MLASRLAPLTTAIDALLAIDADTLDDSDIHELVVELGRQSARLEAVFCRVINRWDRRQIWANNGSKSPAARLARETRMRTSDASRLVHRARALEAMPAATEAYAAGEITGAHVDLVARCDRTWRNTTFAESEAVLVDSCKTPWFETRCGRSTTGSGRARRDIRSISSFMPDSFSWAEFSQWRDERAASIVTLTRHRAMLADARPTGAGS